MPTPAHLYAGKSHGRAVAGVARIVTDALCPVGGTVELSLYAGTTHQDLGVHCPGCGAPVTINDIDQWEIIPLIDSQRSI